MNCLVLLMYLDLGDLCLTFDADKLDVLEFKRMSGFIK